ncbi:MAG: GDSL-type esterase/lipase family protein [Acidimicrobiia bacterium]
MLTLTVLLVAALTGPASAQAPDPDPRVRSVVLLGDSVAAGEGARDGYVYTDRLLFPAWSTAGRARGTSASGGNGVGTATGDACGRSDRAYGVLVARDLGARVANLACSGASFERGMVLDERFDRARPDLVLVTAGANSVAFERAFAYCVLASAGLSEAEADRIAISSTVQDALATALGVAARRVFGATSPSGPPSCTEQNPGAYLRTTVLDRAEAVGASARALAADIRARGSALGRVPDVVFTTYADPLPRATASLAECPDAAGLGAAQLAFLHQMFRQLDGTLRDALATAPGVTVADPDAAFNGHRWCDADPWIYGPSIFVADPASRVPFHPTPAGQRAFADAVLAARRGVPTDWRGLV